VQGHWRVQDSSDIPFVSHRFVTGRGGRGEGFTQSGLSEWGWGVRGGEGEERLNHGVVKKRVKELTVHSGISSGIEIKRDQ